MRIIDCTFVLTPTLIKQIEKMEKKEQEHAAGSGVSEVSGDSGKSSSGAIPKSSKLGAIRSSFKMGGRKKDGSTTEEKEKKSKKNKSKSKETEQSNPAEQELEPDKPKKTSKASSLVRKLSIGKYKPGGSSKVQPSRKSSQTPSTTPELTPTASKLDVSEDDVLSSSSYTSAGAGGRQGPEGDDGITFGSGEIPLSSPPIFPPPEVSLSQSEPSLIASSQSDHAETLSADIAPQISQQVIPVTEKPIESQSGEKLSQLVDAALLIREQSKSEDVEDEGRGMRKAVETVSTELSTALPEAQSSGESSVLVESKSTSESDTQTVYEDAVTKLPTAVSSSITEEDTISEPNVTSLVQNPVWMLHQETSGTQELTKPTSTKSQILLITTPAVKRQQAFEDIYTLLEQEEAAKHLPNITEESQSFDTDAGEFGDIEGRSDEYEDAMVAPSDAMDEARSRLSQSLGVVPAQQVGDKREHLYKILVIGELGTGKTSIIKRYVHQFFSQHYRATIGVDFALKVLNWDTNTIIRLQLWDIAGQERFGNMTRVYYKEAVGAFIVFDVTRAATFDAVVKWKQDLDAKVQLPDGTTIPCVLLANKCDQQKEGIVNNAAKMEEYCKDKGFAAWYETSAKENINIEDAARCLVTKILQNDRLVHNDDSKDLEKFNLDQKGQKDQKEGKSCAC